MTSIKWFEIGTDEPPPTHKLVKVQWKDGTIGIGWLRAFPKGLWVVSDVDENSKLPDHCVLEQPIRWADYPAEEQRAAIAAFNARQKKDTRARLREAMSRREARAHHATQVERG